MVSSRYHPSFLTLTLAFFCVVLIPAWSTSQTNDPASPTSSLAPTAIDETWQKASAKYETVRAAILARVDQVNRNGPFRPDWDSLQNYQVPEWYKDAKFGIFIHWGVYSVPAFGNEWYPREMYQPGTEDYKHQVSVYGAQDKFGYKDFIPRFKAEKFDPSAWARLFKESGAKYVVPVFEHHDGFVMYDCGLSDWTAVRMGPNRDVIGDLVRAVRSEGLHVGASSHRIEHNFFFSEGRNFRSDVNDPRYADFYGPAHHWLVNPRGTPLGNDYTFVSPAFTRDWLARSAEIVEKYQPEIMWFDWWIGQPLIRTDLARFAAFYYNSSLKDGGTIGVINYKDYAMAEKSAVLDVERGQLAGTRESYWQTDTSIGNRSWGYIEHDTFKSPEFVVHQLVDIVSKNGNLLLNIGPRPDGTIPDEQQAVLRAVGAWLRVNGEAIYGARPWRVYGEGPTKIVEGAFHDIDTQGYTPADFRFTTKGGDLYAIELGWPSGRETVIHSVGTGQAGETNVVSVEILGSALKPSFQQRADGLHIQVPEQAPGKFAYVFKIRFAGNR